MPLPSIRRSHAHPDLIPALRDRVRHQSVDPNRRQKQRQCAERSQQDGLQPGISHGLLQPLLHGRDVGKRNITIQLADDLPYVPDH
jgi:hypothetical protein